MSARICLHLISLSFFAGMVYLALFTFKMLNSVVLLGRACRCVHAYEDVMQRHHQLLAVRSKSAPNTPPHRRWSGAVLDFNGTTAMFVMVHINPMRRCHATTAGAQRWRVDNGGHIEQFIVG
jgi:hypothetical protein